jgi:hypothetical protein
MSYWLNDCLRKWQVVMDIRVPVAASAAHVHAANLKTLCRTLWQDACPVLCQRVASATALSWSYSNLLRLFMVRDVVALRGMHPANSDGCCHCGCRQYACACTVHDIAIMLGVNDDLLLLVFVHQLNTAKRLDLQHP